MTGVRMELTGAEEALRFLGDAAAKAEKPRELYDEIGAALVASTQHRFEEEEDPEGNPWPDSLRKSLFGGRTLTVSSRLVGSITHEPSDEGVAVGTNVIYAAIHQFGGTIKAKTPISSFTEGGLRFKSPSGAWVRKDEVTMPRRAFLGIDEDDEAEIEFIAAGYLGAGTDARRPRP